MFRLARNALIVAIISILCCPFASAQGPFQSSELDSQAKQLEQEIRDTKTPVPPASVAALRKDADANVAKNWPAVVRNYSQIVAATPNSAASWFKLALVTLKIAPTDDAWAPSILAPILPSSADASNRAQAIKRAMAAAYISYQKAAKAVHQANGLMVVGLAAAELGNWDVALPALRSGLALRNINSINQRYNWLVAQRGFRVVTYTVQPDAVTPSVCVVFSEGLPTKHIDYRHFLTVAGEANPTILPAEKQLCVDGLKNGQRYTITIRSGLPSASDGMKLSQDVPLEIYIPDRQPTVRFTGRAYVLPRAGQQGIPVVSVNTDNISIKIYRIGDRNVTDTVVNGNFKQDLSAEDSDKLRDDRGALVWSGVMTPEAKLNTEVTTAFPINQAIPNLAAGVYVMTAKPETRKSDDGSNFATQWFVVSDLGLSALSGDDGVTASVNSLASAAAKSGVEIRLLARNNEVLASKKTDASGVVHFEAGLTRGEGGLKPGVLIASDAAGDYAFLSLTASAFDLSDRGVSGRPAPSGLDAFIYTERGVYRTGELVYVTALLRDTKGFAATGVPLTLVIDRPDGIEFLRKQVDDQGIGGHSLKVDIPAAAPTGTWRVHAYVDPKRPPVGRASFLVQDYVPDRLKFTISPASASISGKTPATINFEGQFLYGAPAAGLDLDGDIKIVPRDEWSGFPGYHFGLDDEEATSETDGTPIDDLPRTDQQGKAQLSVPLPDPPASTRLLQTIISIRASDPGGRAVERQLNLPIVPATPMIGAKPLFSGRSLGNGDFANFDVIFLNPDGSFRTGQRLYWQLLKVEKRYQSYLDQSNEWQFEAVKSTHQVNAGQIDLTADQPERIALPLNWGRYRLEIRTSDPAGPITSVAFDAGFYADATTETPDLLEIALDKPAYRAGESLTVAVTARTAGKVTLAVIGDRLLSTTSVDVAPGTARVPLTVGSNWGSGAYVLATLHRPLEVQAGRMPGRSVGVQWFSIDRAAHSLTVDMKLPPLIRPRSTLQVPVSIGGMVAGEEVRIVVAAVDVGILNLTNYKAPSPNDYFLGQRRLSMEIRDLYGQLIDGTQGAQGPIRTGGDLAAETIIGSPPTQPRFALYSGLVTVGSSGTAQVSFDIPDFAGTVRFMAVAWSKSKVGNAAADVIVRDPVVVSATLPRYLTIGDRSTVRLDVDNVEGPPGDYVLTVSGDRRFKLEGGNQKITLAARQRHGVSISFTALSPGTGTIEIHATGPGGLDLRKNYTLGVKPATRIAARRAVSSIGAQQTLNLAADLLANFVADTATVALSIGPSTALDVATLEEALRRYPFDCSEQIASRALPLLYASELLIDPDPKSADAVNDAIGRLLTRQSPEGSFRPWSIASLAGKEDDSEGTSGDDDVWLDAYVTDFLTRARERGYNVPNVAFKLALDHLQNYLSTTGDIGEIDFAKDGANLAYVYYTLARNKLAPVSELKVLQQRYMAEIPTAMARAHIAAALAMLGQKAEADSAFASANAIIIGKPSLGGNRADYGSDLRDAAAVVALASDSGATAKLSNAVVRIADARSLSPGTSTNENAWMLLAARALASQGPAIKVEISGVARNGPVYKHFSQAEIAAGVQIVNSGDNALDVVLSVSGNPINPQPAVNDKGFQIERLYYSTDGKPVDPFRATQNQRFVVVLKVTETKPQFGHLMISDYLPAGFEIDNPDIVSSAKTDALSWIEHQAATVSVEFRDDRFTAAVDRKAEDDPVFSVAYVARAVSPGHYAVPQARVEDMYRTDRYGRTTSAILDIVPAP